MEKHNANNWGGRTPVSQTGAQPCIIYKTVHHKTVQYYETNSPNISTKTRLAFRS